MSSQSQTETEKQPPKDGSWNEDFEKRHPNLSDPRARDRPGERRTEQSKDGLNFGNKRLHQGNVNRELAQTVNGDVMRPPGVVPAQGEWKDNTAEGAAQTINGDSWAHGFFRPNPQMPANKEAAQSPQTPQNPQPPSKE